MKGEIGEPLFAGSQDSQKVKTLMVPVTPDISIFTLTGENNSAKDATFCAVATNAHASLINSFMWMEF